MRNAALIFLCTAMCCVAAHAAPYEIEVAKDLVYGTGVVRTADGAESSTDLKLDAYVPKDSGITNKPVLVIVHGGGFRGGDKQGVPFVRFARYFAERGFACFSINYRLLRDNPPSPAGFGGDVPQWAAAHAAFVDAKTAVRWIRVNKDRFGIDTDRIAVLGGSAGAITAMAVALTNEDAFLVDRPGQSIAEPNHPGVSSRVHACISCWGTAALFPDAMDKDDPPVLLFHGAEDANKNTPPSASEYVYKKCIEAGVPSELHLIPGKGHGAWDATIDGTPLEEVSYGFLQRHLLRSSDR